MPTFTFTLNGATTTVTRRRGRAAALGAARPARRHRPEVRLRRRGLQGVHEPPRRRGVQPVHHPGRRVRGTRRSPRSRDSPTATRSIPCNRRGSTRTSRSAASASPARSWPRPRCSPRTRTRPTPTSTRSTTSAAAAPTSGSAGRSTAPPGLERVVSRDPWPPSGRGVRWLRHRGSHPSVTAIARTTSPTHCQSGR